MNKKFSHFLKCIAAASVFPFTVQAAPDPNFHIYLLLGQSNMQGAAHLPDEPISHPRVRVLQGQNCSETSTPYGEWREHFQPIIRCREGNRQKPDGTSGPIGLSPADTFAVTMADAAGPDVTIGLVGAAYGGAPIEAFLPNCSQYGACSPPYGAVSGAPTSGGTTPMYQWALDLGRKAQEVGVIKGIIFHHGESNSGESTWLPRVNEYISNLRSDLGLNAAEVPFIAGELPRTGCCASAHNPLVHQIPDYVDNGHWVSSGPKEDGTVLGDRSDSLHWSTDSVIEMGKRYAAKMLDVGNYGPVECGTTDDGDPICCSMEADHDRNGVGEQNDGKRCVVTEETPGWYPPNPEDVVVAINVGGSGEALEYDGIYYAADDYVTGGTTNRTEDSVSGANGSAVFSTERFGDYSYDIPLDNGDYTVQFGMVEMYQTNPGSREFNVSVEGEQVINGLDIYQQVGHDTALLSDEFPASVGDGSLNIDVTTITDNGTLSSILVRRIGGSQSSSSVSSSSSSQSSVSSVSSSSSSQGSGTAGGSLSAIVLLLLSGGLIFVRRFAR